MQVVIVTGAAGLVGSDTVRFFYAKGFHVIGIDNDMRKHFFGVEGSTAWNLDVLREECPNFKNYSDDIRDADMIDRIFAEYGKDIVLVAHNASQPSHDWSRCDPRMDFEINAVGTLNLLEATRKHCPEAVFVFSSTNKVYGDNSNRLPFEEKDVRWEVGESHPYFEKGINETLSLDHCTHSLFGASKLSADVLVQEYGRYLGMKTGVFRAGCITGPQHSAAKLHGYLAYLMRCALTRTDYQIIGYKGKQVRDNLHSRDLVDAYYHFFQNPQCGEVYNLGGGRANSCSVIEAIRLCEKITGNVMRTSYVDENRIGDHIWWITDASKFKSLFPGWKVTRSLECILTETFEQAKLRWQS